MPSSPGDHIPTRLRPQHDAIVALTDAIAARHLDAEYAALCRRMAAALARKRPSPLERGEPRTWAAGIVHAVGWVNFLTDPAQEPHLSVAAQAAAMGVGQSTIAAYSRRIRDTLRLGRFDPEWTRPSRLADNPLVWLVLVDGMPIDLRYAPRGIQEEALRRGLIPFLPDDAVPDAEDEPLPADEFVEVLDSFAAELLAGPPPTGEALAAAEELIDRVLAAGPGAMMDELNATLAEEVAGYNDRPQAELGGLSPTAIQRLLDADWTGATSAIRLETSLALDELGPAHTLHDARLLLAMLAEQGSVKATPKGNLPRAFVAAFHERMHERATTRDERITAEVEGTPRNEEDLWRLHLPRILLELAGLLKRRKGLYSLTHRGERLGDTGRAGELFALLVRTHFRELDLSYLDGLPHVPAFQYTIGATLYQFGRHGGEWRKARELTDALVLPVVGDELSPDRWFEELGLMLETRFLRPLVGFGLAESRDSERGPDELWPRPAYRKSALFERAVRFRLESAD